MSIKQFRSHVTILYHKLPHTEIQFIDSVIECVDKLLQPLLKEYDKLVSSSFEERICAISYVLYNHGTLQAWTDYKLWGEDIITPTLPELQEHETRQSQLKTLLCQIKEVIENKEARIDAFSEDVNDDTIWEQTMKDKSHKYIESNIVPVIEERLQHWIQKVDADVDSFLSAVQTDNVLKEACSAIGLNLITKADVYHTVVCNSIVGEILQDIAVCISEKTKIPKQTIQSLQTALTAPHNPDDDLRTLDRCALVNRSVCEIETAIRTYTQTSPNPYRGTRVCDFWDQAPIALYSSKLDEYLHALDKYVGPLTDRKRECDIALSVDMQVQVNGKKMRLRMVGDHDE